MAYPKPSPETEAKILRLYRSGLSMVEVGRQVDCSYAAVRNTLIRANEPRRPFGSWVTPRPWQRAFTDEQEREIARRYEEGALIGELAKEVGTSNKAVNNALRRQGTQLRDRKEAGAHLTRRRRAAGQKHPNFKGGRTAASSGYMQVAIDEDDPMWEMATQRGRVTGYGYGYVLEHRLVMARHLNRPLTRTETVHHINGDRSDNRLENLQLRKGKHGKGKRLVCVDCGSENVREVPI